MRRPDGSWAATPPPYPCFVAESDGCTHRLGAYLDVFAAGDAEEDQVGEEGGSVSPRVASLDSGRGCSGGGAGDSSVVASEMGCVLSEAEMLGFFLEQEAG